MVNVLDVSSFFNHHMGHLLESNICIVSWLLLLACLFLTLYFLESHPLGPG